MSITYSEGKIKTIRFTCPTFRFTSANKISRLNGFPGKRQHLIPNLLTEMLSAFYKNIYFPGVAVSQGDHRAPHFVRLGICERAYKHTFYRRPGGYTHIAEPPQGSSALLYSHNYPTLFGAKGVESTRSITIHILCTPNSVAAADKSTASAALPLYHIPL